MTAVLRIMSEQDKPTVENKRIKNGLAKDFLLRKNPLQDTKVNFEKMKTKKSGNQSGGDSNECYESAISGSSDDEATEKTSHPREQFESSEKIIQINLQLLNIMRQLADSINRIKPIRIKTLTRASQNIEKWFEDYERYTCDWTNKERAMKLSSYLDNAPLKVWEMTSETIKSNYKEIKERLISTLNSKKFRRELRLQIFTAKQETNESISQFADRLRSVWKEWPEASQKEMREVMKETFIYRCNPRVSRALLGSEHSHFKDLVNKAREIEEYEK